MVVRLARPLKLRFPVFVQPQGLAVLFHLRQQGGLHGQFGGLAPQTAHRVVVILLRLDQPAQDRQALRVIAQFLVAAGLLHQTVIGDGEPLVLLVVPPELVRRRSEQVLVVLAAGLVGLGDVIVDLGQGQPLQEAVAPHLVPLGHQRGIAEVDLFQLLTPLGKFTPQCQEHLLRVLVAAAGLRQQLLLLLRRRARPPGTLGVAAATLHQEIGQILIRFGHAGVPRMAGKELPKAIAGLSKLLLPLLGRQEPGTLEPRSRPPHSRSPRGRPCRKAGWSASLRGSPGPGHRTPVLGPSDRR